MDTSLASKLKPNILTLIEKYVTRRQAKNSARSSKPLFANIEKEITDLAIRKREFQAEIEKSMEKLGDLTMFQKYLKPKKRVKSRKLVVEVKPFSMEFGTFSKPETARNHAKRRFFMTSSDLSTDIYTTRPQTTKSATRPRISTQQNSKFEVKRRQKGAKSMDFSVNLEEKLEDVVGKCEDLEEKCVEMRRRNRIVGGVETQKRQRSMEDIRDLVEGLRMDEPLDAKTHLLRRRTDRQIDQDLLCSAGEVKTSILATSQFVAKHAHKGVWRLSTVSLARHADKLINSLPSTRGKI